MKTINDFKIGANGRVQGAANGFTKLASKLLLTAVCLVGLPIATHAQGIMASGTFSSSPVGDGTYNYAMTLNNIGSTNVGTFWFAWIPGLDFLPTLPNSVQTPAGWTYSFGGGYYGYSIEFQATGAPLASGNSLSGFGFNSYDDPATVGGNSPSYPGYKVATSYVYSGGAFSDAGFGFNVQPVPEPSTAALIVGGIVLLMFIARPRARTS